MSDSATRARGEARGPAAVDVGRRRPMKVLIADDHQLMLDGIRAALERCDDLEIVGEAHSGSEVLPVIGRTDPDVVLLDMRMPGMDGLTCLERIRERHPAI